MSVLQIIGYALLALNLIIGFANFIFPRVTIRSKLLIGVGVLFLINEHTVLGKLNLLAVMNGAFSDLSITGIILFAIILFANITKNKILINKIFTRDVQQVILLLGIILYLSVIGVLKFDIYDLGYEPTYLIVGFVILELIFIKLNKLFALIWFIALISFYFNIQNSINFWDYVLDPFLWLYTIILSLYSAIFVREK